MRRMKFGEVRFWASKNEEENCDD